MKTADIFSSETDEERVVRQAPDSSDDENIVRQVYSEEEEFGVEYEPISYSDEERLVVTHGFDQGIFNIKEGVHVLHWGYRFSIEGG